MRGAALAGRHAADDVGAVVDHFLGVEGADAAGEALDEDRGVLVDENCHVCGLPYVAALFARGDGLLSRFCQRFGA